MSKRKAYAKRFGAVAAAAALVAGVWTIGEANAQPAPPPPSGEFNQAAPDQPASPPQDRPLRQREQRRIHQPDDAGWQGPPPGGRGFGGPQGGPGPRGGWNDDEGENTMPPRGGRGEGRGIYVGPGEDGPRGPRGPRGQGGPGFEGGQDQAFGPPPGGEFGPRGHRPPDPEELFKEIDADQNGSITKEEFVTFHETRRPPRMHAQGPGQDRGPGQGLRQGPGQDRGPRQGMRQGPGQGEGPGQGRHRGPGQGQGPGQDRPMPPAPPAGDLPPAPIE